MATKRDYYEILGVAKTATADEIKKAYRQKAIQYHPDKNPGDKEAEEKFKEAAEAYEVLSDPQKRQKYDQFGHAGINDMGGAGDFSVNDIFSMFGDIFGGNNPFESFFGGGGGTRGGSQRRVRRGTDLRIKVALTLEEIATGVEKKVKVKKYVPCSHCHGVGSADGSKGDTCPTCKGAGFIVSSHRGIFGMMQTRQECPTCHGEGTLIKNKCPYCAGEGIEKQDEVITIQIPAGVMEGMQITVQGKGNAAPHGGVNGDLLVLIEEKEHPQLIRDNNNLVFNLLLDLPTAVLGGSVTVPTLDGEAKINIAQGTQPGKVFRLRGKGIKSLDAYGRAVPVGDLIVHVGVYIPESLDKDEKKLFETLKNSPHVVPCNKDKGSFFQNLFQ